MAMQRTDQMRSDAGSSSSSTIISNATASASSSANSINNSGTSTPTRRARSRTSTLTYPVPLPPLISRENSLEDLSSLNTDTDNNNRSTIMPSASSSSSSPSTSASTSSTTPQRPSTIRSKSSLSIDIPRSSPTSASHPHSVSSSPTTSGPGQSRPPHTRASKSVSRSFTGTTTPKRALALAHPPLSASAGTSVGAGAGPAAGTGIGQGAAGASPQIRPDGGLKRRISTPLMPKLLLEEEDESFGAGRLMEMHVSGGQAHKGGAGSLSGAGAGKGKVGVDRNDKGLSQQQQQQQSQPQIPSRARSTSTSIAVPSNVPQPEPTIAVAPPAPKKLAAGMSDPVKSKSKTKGRREHPTWPGLLVTPSTPPDNEDERDTNGLSTTTTNGSSLPLYPSSNTSFHVAPEDARGSASTSTSTNGLLTSMYNAGESSVRRIAGMFMRSTRDHGHGHGHSHSYRMYRRGSDEDSEKGLERDMDVDGDDGEGEGSVDSARSRSSVESEDGRMSGLQRGKAHGNGKYYGAWTGQSDDYFSLPPTPPENENDLQGGSASGKELEGFNDALERSGRRSGLTLPTPALSAQSLGNGGGSGSGHGNSARRLASTDSERTARGWVGWMGNLVGRLQWDADGKMGEVIRDLGWTVGGLILGFFASLGMVLWLLQGLPITTLKHLPKSTTDVQLLSAEIRAYMASGSAGWLHTVGVITFVGCWKHAWSVPGAVVLNILVGSILEPIPALGLLTVITATGSLGSYLLSHPLAPLIAVLFPKPLALVRAALAPESIPVPVPVPANASRAHGQSTTREAENERVTPVHLDATTPPPDNKPTAIWRRLLVMRAMGIVPWSGMNVACGVVGVDWRVFWLTTAAGSASWSYVTASVGNILSRLAIPGGSDSSASTSTLASTTGGFEVDTEMGAGVGEGESLTSLLRDPSLIAKLVFLTGLTLLPVLLKRRGGGGQRTTSPTSGRFENQHGRSSVDAPDFDSEEEGDEKAAMIKRERLLASQGSNVSPASPASPISPSSPLVASIKRFTPTPAAFDLLSFGRTAGRTTGRWLGSVGRGVGGVWGRVVG